MKPIKRETGLSHRHQIWMPDQVADLLAEYRIDMAQAARQHYEHVRARSEVPVDLTCDECGARVFAVIEKHSRALLTFAARTEKGEMFLAAEERK